MLADRIGLDPGSVGTNLIPRAVKLRMLELGLADVQDYVLLLTRSDAEQAALIEEVVIPESWFFRDETPFSLLQQHARAGWLGDPSRPPMRVLSIPCAAGEEPYSIVIALREIGLPPARFRVDAVDISVRRLEQARRGIYSANAFRKLDGRVLDRYFRKVPQGYALEPEIRGHVRFLQASILDPSLLEAEPRYDILFCRNLLIYLQEPSRVRVMAAIDRLLAVDGLLILGHADRLGLHQGEPGFTPVGERGTFAYRRASRPPATSAAGPLSGARALPPPAGPPPRAIGVVVMPVRVAPGPEEKAVVQASRPPQPAGPAEPPSAGSLLDQAEALADRGRREEAIRACQDVIRREGPTSRAFYLMGMIYSSMGSQARADESFSRAIYLDPNHDEALLALALSAERRGDLASSAAFRRRAERAALRKGKR